MFDFNEIHNDDLIGAVHLDGIWRFYLGTIGEWTMQYSSYSPSTDPGSSEYDASLWPPGMSSEDFRDGLYNVDEHNAAAFCRAMSERELTLGDVTKIVNGHLKEDPRLSIVIDFDKRLFVNGTFEVQIQEYVPQGWRGIEGIASHYLPAELNVWAKASTKPSTNGEEQE